jgi:flagellar hook-associated protein 1 FlgK
VADILNIGTSALLSIQRAISTTGHNIANVNTDGYSRQRVDFDTLPPQIRGGSYVGTGVTADGVERVYDQFLSDEVGVRTSSHASYDAYAGFAGRLDNVLADPATGLGPSLEGFFNSMQDVANNPGSLPERQVMLGQAQSLSDRFHYLDGSLRDVNAQVNARIESTVTDINSLAANLADLNEQIVRATATAGGASPNDLLDQRDRLLHQLSEKIGVTTMDNGDGAINVMVGSGQSLVVGATAGKLQTLANPYDASRTEVGVAGLGGSAIDIGRFIRGGELEGILNFREQMLDPARNQLGLVAMGLTDSFNAQHHLGTDLNGIEGGDFFQPIAPLSAAHRANAGSATVAVTLNDASALTGNEYEMHYDGSQWLLTDQTTQATQIGSGPFAIDGLTIAVSGSPANGDRFLVQATRQGATGFDVALTRAEDFAAAMPVRSQAAPANIGSGAVDNLSLSSTANLPLATALTLTFNADALGAGIPGYDVTGMAGGPIAYDPATDRGGKTVTLGDFDMTLSGAPVAGDTLILENNTNGTGDNRNALAMVDLQTREILNNGNASYQDMYSSLIADVAVKTRQADNGAASESVLLAQSIEARDSVSGVNLDEEAANLIQLQQAYQAAAQIISVANTVFQSLLDATRR